MKKLTILILLLTLTCFAQTVEVETIGKYGTYVGDELQDEFDTQEDAIMLAVNLALDGRNSYVLPVDKFEVTAILPQEPNFPVYQVDIADEDIIIEEVTDTKIRLKIINRFEDVFFAYIEFFNDNGKVQQTIKRFELLNSLEELEPDTEYYITVYFAMLDGGIKISNKIIIKTLK